jgi:hypothetical protein
MTRSNPNIVPPAGQPVGQHVTQPATQPVRQPTSTVNEPVNVVNRAATALNPVEGAAAEINPDPKDFEAVKEMLLTAVSTVTGQAKAELTAFAQAMAPTAAVCLVMSRAGDERAAMALKALKTTMLMTAAIYGVKLVQSSELAFLAAVNVGFSMLLGPGGGAVASQAVAAVVGGVSDAVRAKAV